MHIDKGLQILLGNRETLRRSAISGTVSGLLLAVLFVICLAVGQFDIDIDRIPLGRGLDPGSWYVIACASIVFVGMGGRAIGWLLIRPTAFILHKSFPNLGCKNTWIISTISIWLLLALFALDPNQQSNLLPHALLTLVVIIGVIASGLIGGALAARASMGISRKEFRERMVIGGTVTGSSMVSLQAISNLIMSPSPTTYNISGNVIGFCLFLSLISFMSVIPYSLIEPLSIVLSKFNLLDGNFHMAYVLVSGLTWMTIGLLFSGAVTRSDPNNSLGLVYVLAMGLCGACGGWAIGQYKVMV